jgi:hypothetical protein
MLKRVMRRYRLVILCSLAGALGFGACSLDPVPVLPGSDRNLDSQPEVPVSGGAAAGSTSTTGVGVPVVNDDGGPGSDSGTPGPSEAPDDGDGQPDFEGEGGEGGAAGDTST